MQDSVNANREEQTEIDQQLELKSIMATDPAKAQFAQDGTWAPGTRNRHILSAEEWNAMLNRE